jgi:hypothetical protein
MLGETEERSKKLKKKRRNKEKMPLLKIFQKIHQRRKISYLTLEQMRINFGM